MPRNIDHKGVTTYCDKAALGKSSHDSSKGPVPFPRGTVIGAMNLQSTEDASGGRNANAPGPILRRTGIYPLELARACTATPANRWLGMKAWTIAATIWCVTVVLMRATLISSRLIRMREGGTGSGSGVLPQPPAWRCRHRMIADRPISYLIEADTAITPLPAIERAALQ